MGRGSTSIVSAPPFDSPSLFLRAGGAALTPYFSSDTRGAKKETARPLLF